MKQMMNHVKKFRWLYIVAIIAFGVVITLMVTRRYDGQSRTNTELEAEKEAQERPLLKEEATEADTLTAVDKTGIKEENAMEDAMRTTWKETFEQVKIKPSYKADSQGNPLITQAFGADPYAIEYKDRLYVYMTQDILMKDGKGEVINNNYSKVNSLRVISSQDLVNWTDHGEIHVGGMKGVTTWANNSWAPAAIHKVIHGEDKFFLYFANSAASIGVLVADNPVGPFRDPLGKPMITKETPGCEEVAWLFDPAVFTDEDGTSYIYFGGGVPEGKEAMPDTARVMELGEDMVSTVGEAVTIHAPYFFEDSGINKYGDTYYYSYCTNWDDRSGATAEIVPEIAEIAYMTSDHPMGPFTYQGSIVKNPGVFFGVYGNNHHCITKFKGKEYLLYHAFLLQASMGLKGGYRSTNIGHIDVMDDGTIAPVTMDKKGVEQLMPLNPYEVTSFLTMANNSSMIAYEEQVTSPSIPREVSLGDIQTGDYSCVRGVEFEDVDTPLSIKVKVAYIEEGAKGGIKICLDSPENEAIGYVDIQESAMDKEGYTKSVMDHKAITGTHDLYFVFYGDGYRLSSWQFINE